MKYIYKEIRQDKWLPIAIKKEGLRKVARVSGIDVAHISRLISGKRRCTNKTRMRLARAISKIRLKAVKK